MSERKAWWICATAVVILWAIAGFVVGQQRQKRWSEEWYAAHPRVVYDYNPDGLPAANPKASKSGDYWRGYGDASAFCLANLKKLHKQFNEYRAMVEAQPIIKPEPWDCVDGKPTWVSCPAGKLDVPAKELILEHAFAQGKPCDPPLTEAEKQTGISCMEWLPMHEGWTCEDTRRILQRSEDGKLHCILPPASKP